MLGLDIENADPKLYYKVKSTGQYWSAFDACFVEGTPGPFVAVVMTTEELYATLKANNFKYPLSIKDFDEAITNYINIVAKERDFDNALDAASYVNSSQPLYKIEAQAFIEWRDNVWESLYMLKDSLLSSGISTEEYIDGIPKIVWPVLDTQPVETEANLG